VEVSVLLPFVSFPSHNAGKGDYAHVQFRTVREALQAFKAHLRQPLAVDGRNLYVAVEKQDREPYNQLHFEVFGPTRNVDMPSILTSLNLAYKRVRISTSSIC